MIKEEKIKSHEIIEEEIIESYELIGDQEDINELIECCELNKEETMIKMMNLMN